jgi:hypothetical protein
MIKYLSRTASPFQSKHLQPASRVACPIHDQHITRWVLRVKALMLLVKWKAPDDLSIIAGH